MKTGFSPLWPILVALLLVFALAPVVALIIPVQAAPETTRPTLLWITWTVDNEPDGAITAGDTLVFSFSESMMTSTIDTVAELNSRLDSSAGGTADYGTGPAFNWSADETQLSVTLGAGETISGGETVNPASTVTDKAGNPDNTAAPGPAIPGVTGTAIAENIPPALLSIAWTDIDSSGTINQGDRLVFDFSESMDITTIDAANINTRLPTTGSHSYGTSPVLKWNLAGTQLTVTLGSGETIAGGETVNPDPAVKDKAGNADATFPSPAIPTPVPAETTINAIPDYVKSLTSIAGTATAGAGVAGVDVIIQRTIGITIEYWNGTTWQNASIYIAATASDGVWGGTSEGWKITPLPSWTDGAVYTITARAVDNGGNPDPTPATESFTYDVTGPTLTGITWTDVDSSGAINSGDRLIFTFSEAMDDTALDSVSEINSRLDSTSWWTADYGTTFAFSWNMAKTQLTVTLGTGEGISGGETVDPASTVTDRAGNADNTAAPGPAIPTPPPPGPTPEPPRHQCFIATAAYGTPIAKELDVLRAFRDEVLLENALSSGLVALYYDVSPPLAEFIAEHEAVKALVREFLVDPAVWVVEATELLWRK